MNRNFLASLFIPGFLSLLCAAQAPGVARISLITGEIAVRRGDTGEWSAAALNQPLVSGDWVSTGDRSKAELQLDYANLLRLGNKAQVKIATIERAQSQVQIGQGLAYYTTKDSENQVEIDTPNAAIRPTSKEGVYRIEVNGFETQVIVRAGAVDISTPQGSSRVETGQAATVRGTSKEAGYVLGGAPSKDVWDSWNSDRDGTIRNAQSWNYTSRYYVGSEDLDASGRWVNVQDYGLVWSPAVASGWVPYRAGRWVWEPYWGWTWVSKEPWGWAPYHYGRWFLYGKSWMWWPGPVDGGNYRPAWAPAYVMFFGFGRQKGGSAGSGSLGWLPIGPGDYFYPWYGPNASHANAVNAAETTAMNHLNPRLGGVAPLLDSSHFSSVELLAADRQVRKAISTLPADRFGTGRSAPKAVGRAAFRDRRLLIANLPIAPTKETLTATNPPASPSSMTVSSEGYVKFFTKKQPAATPHPLNEQVAQAPESVRGSGQVVPARDVTQLDLPGTEPPLPSEIGVKRTVQPTKNLKSEGRSKPQPDKASRIAPSRTKKITSNTTRRAMAREHESRGATARVASRSSGSHTAMLSRVPNSRSTHRMTLPPESHGAIARYAQSYVDSANRQMEKGNYTAAIGNYRRASEIDGNSAAARVGLGRARRAMQAEHEILANRR